MSKYAIPGITFITKPRWFLCPLLDEDDNAGHEFMVLVKPVDSDAITKLQKKYTKKKGWDNSTRQPNEILNEQEFNEAFHRQYIKGWEGLTLAGVSNLTASEIDPESKSDDIVVFSESIVNALMAMSTNFANWIFDTVRNQSAFSRADEELDKNFMSTSKRQPKTDPTN